MVYLVGVLAVVILAAYSLHRLRLDAKLEDQNKHLEAINDQNDELLEYIKREKDFYRLISSDPAYRDRVLKSLRDRKKR